MIPFAAIELKMEDGNTLRCSGITDDARTEIFNNPPEPGAHVTVEYGDLSEDSVHFMRRTGIYDNFGSPPYSACEGTGKQRWKPGPDIAKQKL